MIQPLVQTRVLSVLPCTERLWNPWLEVALPPQAGQLWILWGQEFSMLQYPEQLWDPSCLTESATEAIPSKLKQLKHKHLHLEMKSIRMYWASLPHHASCHGHMGKITLTTYTYTLLLSLQHLTSTKFNIYAIFLSKRLTVLTRFDIKTSLSREC